jgi:antitoxin VapB
MAISIRNKKAEQLAREIAQACNTSMTEAIIEALEEKKKKLQENKGSERARFLEIKAIGKRCASIPDKDTRSPEEILGYNDEGTF